MLCHKHVSQNMQARLLTGIRYIGYVCSNVDLLRISLNISRKSIISWIVQFKPLICTCKVHFCYKSTWNAFLPSCISQSSLTARSIIKYINFWILINMRYQYRLLLSSTLHVLLYISERIGCSIVGISSYMTTLNISCAYKNHEKDCTISKNTHVQHTIFLSSQNEVL